MHQSSSIYSNWLQTNVYNLIALVAAVNSRRETLLGLDGIFYTKSAANGLICPNCSNITNNALAIILASQKACNSLR